MGPNVGTCSSLSNLSNTLLRLLLTRMRLRPSKLAPVQATSSRPNGGCAVAGRLALVAGLAALAITSPVAAQGTGAIIETFAGGGRGDGVAEIGRYPGGVAVDGSGNVYIADAGNYRIRKVDSSGTISTFAGTGTAGFGGGRRIGDFVALKHSRRRGSGRFGQRLHRRHFEQPHPKGGLLGNHLDLRGHRHSRLRRRRRIGDFVALKRFPKAWQWTVRATSTSPTL